MIIPVRIAADTKPVLASERRFTAHRGHPLDEHPCPVCDGPLGDQVSVLIVAGIAPEDRKPGGYTTGAAVAVHALCAGFREEEPPDGYEVASEFRDLDWKLVDRVKEFRGRIEDMPDDERVFLLGALAAALERRLGEQRK
jgi:hypothetical protein